MAGIQKVRLNNLNINLKNALIIGIIIAKNSPRTIGPKKKNGESRGITSFTLRDSEVDTINVDVWGSEYFVITFYERFLVGDIVEISSPKICVKGGDNEMYRPHVSSPFYLSLNEGISDMTTHNGDTYTTYLPLLHVPTKSSSGYCGIAEVVKLSEQTDNVYVDLLVVVKSVSPTKTIRTKTGSDMTIRSVEIIDNTSPASLFLDMFDIDTIQRADEWQAENVLFIADARVTWRSRAVKVQVCSKTVITHQPYTADAEALKLYIRNQNNTGGGAAAAWAAWSGERPCTASVAQIRDRLATGAPFCASLHATVTRLSLEDVFSGDNKEDILISFADHTGELSARLPLTTLPEVFGYSVKQLKMISSDDRAALNWNFLLEQCSAKLASSPPRLIVLTLRRASPADPIPLY
ncbi:meiosis-specific with OB domain-containing protein-like [Achroia grisella]|uniref:meiosis-specific with OB domain-containing protein-like n=1 Tax=Achroia grisella TaxID=688607 RepID=UPI0027D2B23D|nr:meiosis-specific with OB domain-containing protein-like [Achroia grisella]